jgi:aspartate kinase
MNLMQNSALNFSACFDANRSTPELFEDLKSQFVVRYNEAVELITIRQYTSEAIAAMTNGRVILDSQVTRKVARFILQ